MAHRHAARIFNSEHDTALFARALGQLLRPGDILLLEGEIGAGKTFLARTLIQSLMDPPEDVPSPTFTLVQTYDTSAGELWHSDLYRLTSTDEIEELGLFDAFATAICLIEWPDRLGDEAPLNAVRILLETIPNDINARRATLSWVDDTWTDRLSTLQGASHDAI